MTVVINGTTGFTGPQADGDATINGLTVGKGLATVSTNTAVGVSALAANTSGATNTAVGNTALQANTTGINNSALGHAALVANLGGSENSAYGSTALVSNTSGNYNTAVGRAALYSNTTASNNTAVGYQAGYTQSTPANGYNTYLGYKAGYSNATSDYNTYVGEQAGYSATGGFNTFVGVAAGYSMTTGTKNTILGGFTGANGGLDIRTASNYIVLSDGDGYPRMYFDGAGSAIINATSGNNSAITITGSAANATNFKLSMGIQGINNGGFQLYDVTNSAIRLAIDPNGFVSLPATPTTAVGANMYMDGGTSPAGKIYRSTSSIRYKTDVVDLSSEKANRLLEFRPVEYKSLTNTETPSYTYYGFIAEEIAEIEPRLVHWIYGEDQYEEVDGMLKLKDGAVKIPDGIQYDRITALLVKTVQELNAKVDAQAAEIAALKAK